MYLICYFACSNGASFLFGIQPGILLICQLPKVVGYLRTSGPLPIQDRDPEQWQEPLEQAGEAQKIEKIE
jgi:hypothetical protein